MSDEAKEEAKALAVRLRGRHPRSPLRRSPPYRHPPTPFLALPSSPQAEEAAIEMFKVKKLIKSLERARG